MLKSVCGFGEFKDRYRKGGIKNVNVYLQKGHKPIEI